MTGVFLISRWVWGWSFFGRMIGATCTAFREAAEEFERDFWGR